MRDDFQVPNIGQATDTYEKNFFSRMARNIEMTFMTMRAKGQGIFADLHADTLDVLDTLKTKDAAVSGNLTTTGNATITGGLTAQTLHSLGNTNVDTNLTVSGSTSLVGATSVSTLAVSGNETVAGTLGVTGVTTLNSDLEFKGKPTRNGYAQWETIFAGAITSQATFQNFLNLGAYRLIRLCGYLVPDTTGGPFYMQCTTNNGSTWINGSSDYQNDFIYLPSGTTTVSGSQGAAAAIHLSWGNTVPPLTTNNYGIHIYDFTITNFNTPNISKTGKGTVSYYLSSALHDGTTFMRPGSSAMQSTGLNGLRIYCGSGATAFSGHLLVEGIRG